MSDSATPTAFIYRNGFARFASRVYSHDVTSLGDRFGQQSDSQASKETCMWQECQGDCNAYSHMYAILVDLKTNMSTYCLRPNQLNSLEV